MSINIRKRGWGKVFKSKKSIVSGIEKIWYYAFYYVSTVGLNEATIKKYIQEQEKITEINLFIELTEADKKYQDIKNELVKEILEIDIKLNQPNKKIATLNKMAEVLINLKSEDHETRN